MAGNNGTASLIKSSRPGIAVAGKDDVALSQRLLSLMVAETVHGLYRCEAVFNNWGDTGGAGVDFLYFDRKQLDFGKAFTVKLDQDTLFDGRVTALGPSSPRADRRRSRCWPRTGSRTCG
jgi:hypothetical protein